MKSFLFTTSVIAMFLISPFFLFGQNYVEDVVYLKNGSIIHGLIIEQIPNQSIKIQTKDNNIFVFKMEEIEKLTKESPSTDNSSSTKKKPTGRLRNSFMGFYMGVDFATLGPDSQNFCDEVASALNQTEGFSSFSLSPHSRTGFTIGMTTIYRITGPLFLQTELTYISRGMVIKGTGSYTDYYGANASTVTVEERIKLNYFKVPFLLKYYFFPKGSRVKGQNNFNVYLQAGPSVALAVSRNIKTIVSIDGSSNDDTQDFKDYIKGFDFSLDFGGGVEIFKILTLDFRYDLGLINIWEDEANEPSAMKNRGFSINLGCNFSL
jgi:hypothetical protein